ncbi:hypothetical protein [Allorhodopirellula solitaria]|uniref:Uncharacterized protein n=1 Tax=Allorhodopirellula solitaria TaxID=2527987 RepID=A0A5C5XZH7_9BACT|nr:hypothetical protein [Allorhodopirellula solitaria]TWT67355.1 hypothetical protein CA85_22050 [Allorhodopirellula solitaria]
MARDVSDREDLLAEGVNLPQRGRVSRTSDDHQWVVGWRNDTAISLFDGADPVFQFNTAGELRRVFLDGQKLAAEARRLVRLVRSSDQAGPMSHTQQPLGSEEQTRVMQCLATSTADLMKVLSCGDVRVETVGIDPHHFLARLNDWLASQAEVQIAHGPGVVG